MMLKHFCIQQEIDFSSTAGNIGKARRHVLCKYFQTAKICVTRRCHIARVVKEMTISSASSSLHILLVLGKLSKKLQQQLPLHGRELVERGAASGAGCDLRSKVKPLAKCPLLCL